MRNLKKILLNKALPRIVYLPYLIAIPMYWIVELIGNINNYFRRDKKNKKKVICIEAGIRGWEIIEYKELYQSAIEYMDENSVIRIEVTKNDSYLKQIKRELVKSKPTHYAYSPRTGGQTWLSGLLDAFGLMILFTWYKVIPIVFLTDFPVRLWRAQSAVLTVNKGLVVSLMSPNQVKGIFPHNRIIGPYLMAFSNKTLSTLKDIRVSNVYEKCNNPLFTGSLYEPRTTTLNLIKISLKARGFEFDIKGRDLGSSRVTDEEYWWRLISAPIVLTTADQIPNSSADWPWLPHFIYRYTEVLACGTLLLAPKIPGVNRYFIPGIHYVEFNSVEDAVDKIIYYIINNNERNEIAERGKERLLELVKTNSFWLGIDISLGVNSLT